MDMSGTKSADERARNYQKRATRRTIRALHNAITVDNIADVEKLLTPDVDVNFHYGGQSALQIAVTGGFVDICELLIEHGADVNKFNAEDNTLLNMAAWRGFTKVAEILINNGADLDVKNNYGYTALHTAAYKGFCSLAKVLVDAQCNLDSCDSQTRRSPIGTCAHKGHADLSTILIEAGCNINWTDHEMRSALHIAAHRGHTNVVKELVKACDCCLDLRDKFGCTALKLASKEGHEAIVDVLIAAGADINIPDHMSVSPVMDAVRNQHLAIVKALAEAGCNVNIVEVETKQAPIHAAIRIATQFYGPKDTFTDLVHTLIDAGCDLNVSDKFGDTPLYQAASGGEIDMVSVLLKHRCSTCSVTVTGNTVLHGAALGHKPDIMRLLIDEGCDVNKPNDNNELPLFTAVDFRCNIDIVKQLLDAGSRTDVCENKKGQSILFCAIKADYSEAVELLIQSGANVNTPNVEGDSPLYVACNMGNRAIIHSLLNHRDIDINAGISHIPLHAVCVHGYYDVAEALLRAGADVNKLTDICSSALYLAADSNHTRLVELLIRYGGNPSAQELVKPPQQCCHFYTDPHPHLELDPLYAAVKNDNFHMIKLLLLGAPRTPYYVIMTLRDLIFRTSFAQQARMSQTTIYQYATFFAKVLGTPSSLQVACRGIIRLWLGSRKQVAKVEALPLPRKLKDFLLLHDVLKDSVTEED